MKISVLTLQYGNLSYFPYSSAINKYYCQRHSYDWLVTDKLSNLKDRDPMWSKVKRVSEMLERKEHDYVLFLDADAWFFDQRFSIQSLINNNMNEKALFLIGNDCRDKDFRWNVNDGNMGVFLIKNTTLSRHIVAEWWNVPHYDRSCCYTWPLEQRAFNLHIRPRWQNEGYIQIIPYQFMNGRDGMFIRHAVGHKRKEKYSIFEKEHRRIIPH